jgi:hypothetical protein
MTRDDCPACHGFDEPCTACAHLGGPLGQRVRRREDGQRPAATNHAGHTCFEPGALVK